MLCVNFTSSGIEHLNSLNFICIFGSHLRLLYFLFVADLKIPLIGAEYGCYDLEIFPHHFYISITVLIG